MSSAMQPRRHEETKSRFRSDRFFTINSEWYFATRERQNIGPFGSVHEARNGLHRFLTTLKANHTSYDYDYAETVAKNGEWAWTNYS